MKKTEFIATMIISQAYKDDIVKQLRLLAKAIDQNEYEETVLFIELKPTISDSDKKGRVHLFCVESVYLRPVVIGEAR